MRPSLLAVVLLSTFGWAQTPPCTATATASPESTVFEFSGVVHPGESFQCELVSDIRFQLVPVNGGWQIAVHAGQHDENLAHPAPRAKENSLLIAEGDFIDATNPAMARNFVVALGFPGPNLKRAYEKTNATFKATDIKRENTPGRPFPAMVEMSFVASIELPMWDGNPVFMVGGLVSLPKATSTPDPDYSEEARQANYDGTVVLSLIVGPDGNAKNVRVQRPLGKGLDEKAVQSVSQWKFKPATFDGHPVPVQINVEVSFRMGLPPTR